MRRVVCLTMIIALLLICLSSCSGYNKIMRDHLSSPGNYHSYNATVVDLYYQNTKSNEIFRNFDSSDCFKGDVTIIIRLWDPEEILPFLGSAPDPDAALIGHEIPLCITANNSKLLYESGFYETISIGDKVEVMASNWIYMDSNFFYVTQVTFDDVVYLTFEDGLHNIVVLMNRQKSLF